MHYCLSSRRSRKTDSSVHRSSLAATLLGGLILAFSSASTQAQQTFIAYEVPAATPGTQNFGGVIGMDFDVDNAILVTQLGVFDENSDGLKLTITARLFDRATQTELASIDFTPDDAGQLIGGSRFKKLTTPLRLEAGFQGTMAAEGYGADERLNNSGGTLANVVWTVNNGNGSIRFVGNSRFGVNAGEFPGTADSGPAARYAAGTFEFQTTPPQLPGTPAINVKGGDKQVTISWDPITAPLPAANYQVLRAGALAGPFTQIADSTQTNYTDVGLTNGVQLWYTVRAVSANGKVSPDSPPKSVAPYALATNHFIAYFTPAGKVGTQAFGGSLGMDFDLENPILVKRLGVFDDASDGLNLTITARIFNRDTKEILAELTFSPDDAGEAIEGMRFKPLSQPLRLEAGFKGVIEADGYGTEEKLLNSGGSINAVVWTLNDGNGSVVFVGTSRYGVNAGEFPDTLDDGPAARYAAGTFEFEALPPTRPGTPQLTIVKPTDDGALSLQWPSVLTPLPAAKYIIQRSTNSAATFAQIAETTENSYRDAGLQNGLEYCYVIHAIAAGGQVGADSPVECATPNPRRAGIAYVNPAGTTGNQSFDGALGMDFDVAKPVRVTRLGVFDDGQDGLTRTITAILYDRDSSNALARVQFTPEDSGELIEGSRFKTLPSPILLSAGFHGTMFASGYGDGEQLHNLGIGPADLVTFDGGSLVFVGGSRFGVDATLFPGTLDTGPANRYAAGTFAFEPAADQSRLGVSLGAGKVKITWTGVGILERAATLPGTWDVVTGALSGIEIPANGASGFFRLRQ